MLTRDRVDSIAWNSATLIAVATRVLVLLVGVVAVLIVGTKPAPVAEALWRVAPTELGNLLARWDTAFYYSIATTGYDWNPAVFSHQNVVFFPLFPLLMRWGGAALGGHPLAAGLIVSLAAFVGGIAILARLVAFEMGDEFVWPVILLISTFPYALFFSVVYTESLFLFLSVGAFYAMRRGALSIAAGCGLLAGLTRPNGMWLALALVWIALSSDYTTDGSRPNAGVGRAWCALAAACAPLLGTLMYSSYLHLQFGDALAWAHGQAAWGFPLFGRASAQDVARLPGEAPVKVIEVVTWMGNFGALLVAAVATIPVARRFGVAYAFWIAVNIFPPVGAHLLMSLGRFVAVLFPVFFWLAVRIPRGRLTTVGGVFLAGQLLLAWWFFVWQPVV